MIESLSFILLGKSFPIDFCCLKHTQCAEHIGAGEGERVFDGTVHVALRCKVDDSVNFLVLHQFKHGIKVANIHSDKLVVRFVFHILEVFKVSGIGQFVEVYDLVVRVFVHKQTDYVAADETGTTCDDDGSFEVHNRIFREITQK